jgi:hypothetical protein
MQHNIKREQELSKISALGILAKPNRGVPRYALLFSFANFPALLDMHEAPQHAAVLKSPPVFDASRLRRLESRRIALLFWRLGLRRLPLALGLAPCARELADGYGFIAHLQDY